MKIFRTTFLQIESGKSAKAGRFALLTASIFLASCGGGSADSSPPPVASCSVTQLETDMTTILSQATSDVDFSFVVERQDGRRYNYNRGASTLQTSYESASTSKLVTAVIILRLVEQGYLNLSDRPQDRIGSWPIANTDPLYNMTLAQLLSFTAGLTTEPACLNAGFINFETCVNNIATANAGNGISPGQEFYYASTYLQVAGLMAIKARGVATWQDVFSEFKTQTGLFANGAYDLPSASNPRLAGGMHWTGEEYMAFLTALKKGLLLNPTSMNQLLADHTVNITMANSPSLTDLGEDWHYGFGLWQECQSTTYNCTPGTRVSSPGSYGAYPYWDRVKAYTGLLARQGPLRSFSDGAAIERAVRPKVEEWVACQ
ncbi:MAG TPA: serine hydrolase domain-containing protein [Burkholderiaceae bacterium]|jgi:CubicO group peptidase (beta-lactamase class C family)